MEGMEAKGEKMRRKQVWRYYCEFCGKGSCSGGGMAIHEKHCTMNPNRECRMCDASQRAYGDAVQQPIADLIAALGDGQKTGMAALRELASSCPACILAAIRQSGLPEAEDARQREGTYGSNGDIDGTWMAFNFKKEADGFWSDYNANERENDCASYQGCW